ncbi:MAG TPA: fumarylacetoacetate hydrolase family protein [Saprospiraceae bacterium]|nr:fumarylacetoacetate hydrolase family protein [Saprospiraceae bacterium]
MKIICIGRNFVDHAKELNNPVPKNPMIFMKPATALLIDNKPFYYPSFSNNIHYEVEILVKISKNGKHIEPTFAEQYYEEIGLGIDFTARDLQDDLKSKGHPWEIAKAFDHSAVVSHFIKVNDLENRANINFQLYQNEILVQNGYSKDMIFSINELIVYISKYFTLQKGDIIFTGTPAGVGKIEIGDHFKGLIESKEMFTCLIK